MAVMKIVFYVPVVDDEKAEFNRNIGLTMLAAFSRVFAKKKIYRRH